MAAAGPPPYRRDAAGGTRDPGGQVARLTSQQRLMDLHQVLAQAAAQVADVRARLGREVDESRTYWQGNAADAFRHHVGPDYRDHHLAVAHQRLFDAARLALQAAMDHDPSPVHH